ncbi:hypothetical protein Droror1_Dr00010921 [Drosera rotundifolia]
MCLDSGAYNGRRTLLHVSISHSIPSRLLAYSIHLNSILPISPLHFSLSANCIAKTLEDFEPTFTPERRKKACMSCVPTILILMQRRLYAQVGLQCSEVPDVLNSLEEFMRDGLNRGIIPENMKMYTA